MATIPWSNMTTIPWSHMATIPSSNMTTIPWSLTHGGHVSWHGRHDSWHDHHVFYVYFLNFSQNFFLNFFQAFSSTSWFHANYMSHLTEIYRSKLATQQVWTKITPASFRVFSSVITRQQNLNQQKLLYNIDFRDFRYFQFFEYKSKRSFLVTTFR